MSPLFSAAVLLPVLLLTQSAHAIRRRLTSVLDSRPTFATPNYTYYHRQDELLREVVGIVRENPGFMKLEVFSEKDGAYDAEMKIVTVEPGGFSNQQHEKVRMLLDFGEHGRELISSELGLLLLKTLAARGGEGVMRVFPGELDRGKELLRLLQGTVIKILPMENEGGRRLVEAGKLCERKNGRGVDPNRNWAVDWGTKEPDYDPNEEYPGTAPFSEPETKLIRRLAEEFRPHVWLNIHSGMEAMLAPWDHVAEIAAEARPVVDILQRIFLDLMGNTTCVIGSGGKTVGYLAHGTATDYMFKVLQVPIASTWEIYGDLKAHFDDCFRMFNPVVETEFKEVLQRWLRAIMRLVELMPEHPALKGSKAWSLPRGGGGDGTGGAQLQHQDGAALGGGGGQGNVQGGGMGAGATTSNTHITSKASSSSTSTTSNTTIITGTGQTARATAVSGSASSAGGSDGSSSSSSSGAGGQPQVAVVASIRDWGSSWNTEVTRGLLALAGLVVVGVLAYRYGIRRLRGGTGGGGSPFSRRAAVPAAGAAASSIGAGLAGRKGNRTSV